MLYTILIVLLVLALLGGLPNVGYGYTTGPVGGIGLIVIILLVVLLWRGGGHF